MPGQFFGTTFDWSKYSALFRTLQAKLISLIDSPVLICFGKQPKFIYGLWLNPYPVTRGDFDAKLCIEDIILGIKENMMTSAATRPAEPHKPQEANIFGNQNGPSYI
jgi:hypothetical protein